MKPELKERAVCKRHWTFVTSAKAKEMLPQIKWVYIFPSWHDPNYPHEVEIECAVCEWQQSIKDDETIQLFLDWLRVV